MVERWETLYNQHLWQKHIALIQRLIELTADSKDSCTVIKLYKEHRTQIASIQTKFNDGKQQQEFNGTP